MRPARAEDHRLGRNRVQPDRPQLDPRDPLAAAVVYERASDEPFLIPSKPLVFERGLLERVEHVEAGLVGGENDLGPRLIRA